MPVVEGIFYTDEASMALQNKVGEIFGNFTPLQLIKNVGKPDEGTTFSVESSDVTKVNSFKEWANSQGIEIRSSH